MNNQFKLVGTALFVFIFMGAGCQKISNNTVVESVSSTPVQEDVNQEYVWKEEGISFKYPKNMFVIDQGDLLYLNVTSPIFPEGEESVYYTKIEIIKNKTVKQALKPYYDNEKILKGETIKKIGDYNFTRLQYEDNFSGQIIDQYFLQIGKNVLDYKAGYKDNKGDVELTLSSLKFNE
jgi:hypothetical protein